MCLYIPWKEASKTATKNIICYKKGYIEYLDFKSQLMGFLYTKKKINPTVSIKPRELLSWGVSDIEEGYHTYITCPNKTSHDRGIFVIPKGTKYYEGSINDDTISGKDGYVSEQLVYIGPYNIFNKIRAFFY